MARSRRGLRAALARLPVVARPVDRRVLDRLREQIEAANADLRARLCGLEDEIDTLHDQLADLRRAGRCG